MDVRVLREEEIETLIDDLWLPFAGEMAELDSYNGLVDDPRKSAIAYRREQFEAETVQTFVADSEGTLAGYTVVEHRESPPVFARGSEANIDEVYVAPEYRERGVATQLMDRTEEWARERECERVTLSVNARNDAATELYESRGYSVRRHKMDKRPE